VLRSRQRPAEDAVHRVKRILDAKCDKADIEKICEEQAELDKQQREQLAVLLCKCEALFDGQLGQWHGQEVKLELQEGAKPHHARACNAPRCHMQTLKAEVEHLEAEVEHLVKIGVLKKVNRSEWAAPTFMLALVQLTKHEGNVYICDSYRLSHCVVLSLLSSCNTPCCAGAIGIDAGIACCHHCRVREAH